MVGSHNKDVSLSKIQFIRRTSTILRDMVFTGRDTRIAAVCSHYVLMCSQTIWVAIIEKLVAAAASAAAGQEKETHGVSQSVRE